MSAKWYGANLNMSSGRGDDRKQGHHTIPTSISKAKEALEKFLSRSVIPPPPHVSLEEGEELLKKAEQQLASLQEQLEIRCASHKLEPGDDGERRRIFHLEHNDDDDVENERNVAVSNTNNSSRSDVELEHVSSRSASGPDGAKLDKNAASGSGSALVARGLFNQHSISDADTDRSSSNQSAGDEKRKVEAATVTRPKAGFAPTAESESFDSDLTTLSSSNTATAVANEDDAGDDDSVCTATVISLKNFSGLEETDHEAPVVTRVKLRDFIGLETSPSRSETSIGRRISIAASPSGFASSIPTPVPVQHQSRNSVPSDACPTPELAISPRHQPITPVSYAGEDLDEKAVFRSQKPKYYYHRQRGSLHADPDAVESMWPEQDKDELEKTTTEKPPLANGEVHVNGSSSISSSFNSSEHGRRQSASEDDFATAQSAVMTLLDQLKEQVDNLPLKSPRRVCATVNCKKEQQKGVLLSEAQQFASIAKALVRSVVETHQRQTAAVASSDLVMDGSLPFLDRGVDRGCRLFTASAQLMQSSETLFQSQTLGAKVREVLVAFERTLEAAKQARGKPLGGGEMKRLMRQSTTLAATLTQLIRTAREM